jgi:hypothetical protein
LNIVAMTFKQAVVAGLCSLAVLSAVLPARADQVLGAPYAGSGHSGNCSGDPGTTCSHTELADATTGRLALDLRVGSSMLPAHAYADGDAGIEADATLLAAVASVKATVHVHVAHASIAHEGALLGPLAALDANRSRVVFFIQATVNGCACSAIVEPVLVDDAGVTSVDGKDLSFVLTVTNSDGGSVTPGTIAVDVSAYGIARLAHDANGVTLPEAGTVAVAADLTLTDVRIA